MTSAPVEVTGWTMQEAMSASSKPTNPCNECKQSVRSQRAVEAARRDFNFSDDQPWVKTNRTLNFVDETSDVVNLHDSKATNLENVDSPSGFGSQKSSPQVYGTGFASSPSSLPSQASSEPTRKDSDTSTLNREEHPRKKRTLSSSNSFSSRGSFRTTPRWSAAQLLTPTYGGARSQSTEDAPYTSCSEPLAFGQDVLFSPPGDEASDAAGSVIPEHLTPRDHVAEHLSGFYLEVPRWPLEDREEARLFRYFVQDLAPLFDLCDKDRHFATVVPSRAVRCPPLMNAIFAASAKRLSRITDYDGYAVDRYHQNCLNALIPALSISAAIMDENLLTAIVILRFMEELDVPIASTAAESHLWGTRVFVAAQEKARDFTGLRLAAFWVALRQEIHMAFIQTRPVHPDFSFGNVTRMIQADDDGCGFANQTIIQCASCIRYCYGAEEQSVAGWERLRSVQEQWWQNRPWNFHPAFIQETGDDMFPEEVYINDAVVTGVQHYYLAQVLLEAHNPKMPKLGPGQAIAVRTTNNNIKRLVLRICGIAESNPHTAPAYVNACIAITMAGDRFTNVREQQALFNILVKTDTELGWPTRSAQEHLRHAWDWTEPHNAGMPLADMLNDGLQQIPNEAMF